MLFNGTIILFKVNICKQICLLYKLKILEHGSKVQ